MILCGEIRGRSLWSVCSRLSSLLVRLLVLSGCGGLSARPLSSVLRRFSDECSFGHAKKEVMIFSRHDRYGFHTGGDDPTSCRLFDVMLSGGVPIFADSKLGDNPVDWRNAPGVQVLPDWIPWTELG